MKLLKDSPGMASTCCMLLLGYILFFLVHRVYGLVEESFLAEGYDQTILVVPC